MKGLILKEWMCFKMEFVKAVQVSSPGIEIPL